LHFGTGLFATAYAVVARMHLQSRAAEATEINIEQVMDSYVAKSSELVKNVEAASSQLATFSREIVARTIEAAELTRLAANEKMLSVADEFAAQMSETLENARQGVHDFRVVMNSTAFAAERKQYTDSMKETVSAASALNKVLADLITKRREEVNVSQLNITATTNSALRLGEFASQVQAFAGPKGAIAGSAAALHDATVAVTQATGAIAGTVSGLEQVVANVDDGSAALKTIRTLSKRAADQLDILTTSSQRAGDVAVHVGELADSAKSLVRRVRTLDTVIDSLSDTTGNLAENLGRAEIASLTFDSELAKLPDQLSAVEVFGARVERSLEGASKLADHASTIETSVTSLHKVLLDFAASVTEAQHSMVNAASTVKSHPADPARARDENVVLRTHMTGAHTAPGETLALAAGHAATIDQPAEAEAKS